MLDRETLIVLGPREPGRELAAQRMRAEHLPDLVLRVERAIGVGAHAHRHRRIVRAPAIFDEEAARLFLERPVAAERRSERAVSVAILKAKFPEADEGVVVFRRSGFGGAVADREVGAERVGQRNFAAIANGKRLEMPERIHPSLAVANEDFRRPPAIGVGALAGARDRGVDRRDDGEAAVERDLGAREIDLLEATSGARELPRAAEDGGAIFPGHLAATAAVGGGAGARQHAIQRSGVVAEPCMPDGVARGKELSFDVFGESLRGNRGRGQREQRGESEQQDVLAHGANLRGAATSGHRESVSGPHKTANGVPRAVDGGRCVSADSVSGFYRSRRDT